MPGLIFTVMWPYIKIHIFRLFVIISGMKLNQLFAQDTSLDRINVCMMLSQKFVNLAKYVL